MSPSSSSFLETPAPIVTAGYVKKFETYGRTTPHVFLPVEQICGEEDCDVLSDRLLMITHESISIGCRNGSVMYYARLSEIDSVVVGRELLLFRCCPRIGTTVDLLIKSSKAASIVANAVYYKSQTFRLPLPVIQASESLDFHSVGWLSDGFDMVDALLWEIPRREESHLNVRPSSPAEAKELMMLYQLRHDLSKAEKGLRGEPRPLDRYTSKKTSIRCAMHESLVPAFSKIDAIFLRIVQQLTRSGKKIDSVIAVCSEAVFLCDFEGNVKRMLRYQQLQEISSTMTTTTPVVQLTPLSEEGEEIMKLALIDDDRNCHPQLRSLINALERAVLDSKAKVRLTNDDDNQLLEGNLISTEIVEEENRRETIRLKLPKRGCKSPIKTTPELPSALTPRRRDILKWLVKSALPYSESQLETFSTAVIDCETPEVLDVTKYLMDTVKTMSHKERESNKQEIKKIVLLQGKVASLEATKRQASQRELELKGKCDSLESSLRDEETKRTNKYQELEATINTLKETVERLEGGVV